MERSKKMKNLLMLFLFAGAMFTAGAAEEIRDLKLNEWFTWKSPKNRAKFVRSKANAQYPQGAVRFDVAPGEGRYAATTYGNEKISAGDKFKFIITVKFSEDVNSDVKVGISLNGKNAKRDWYKDYARQVRPAVTAAFAVAPGKESTAEVEVDLAKYKLPEIVTICPFVSVSDLKSGSVTVTKCQMIVTSPEAAGK